MKGKLHKTELGWMVRYFDTGKAHDIMYCGESLPLYSKDATYCLDSDNGKCVDFEILLDTNSPTFEACAKLTPTNENKPNLDNWDEIFNEIYTSLHAELPLRVKYWLTNKYHEPKLRYEDKSK